MLNPKRKEPSYRVNGGVLKQTDRGIPTKNPRKVQELSRYENPVSCRGSLRRISNGVCPRRQDAMPMDVGTMGDANSSTKVVVEFFLTF